MKLIIVGGVAGGATAAARARRLSEDSKIIVFERGSYVSFANCGLPYYVGKKIPKKESLLIQKPNNLKERFNLDLRVGHDVLKIDREGKRVKVKNRLQNTEYWESYDYLILSPGAKPVVPHIKGVGLPFVFTVRTIPDVEAIIKYIEKNKVKKALIVGAGYIGIEMAENLRNIGLEVLLVEKLGQIMPVFDSEMAIQLQREMESNSVKIFLNEEVSSIEKTGSLDQSLSKDVSTENKGKNLCQITTSSGKSLGTDIVILCIGVVPEIDLAKEAGLKLGKKGIIVDKKMKTSDNSIYAIGDAVEVENPILGKTYNVPLAGPATKQALVSVNNIFGIEDEYHGSIGTSIIGAFGLVAAISGVSEKQLESHHIPFEKVYLFPYNHVTYYPGATVMSIKVIFDITTGIVLGAQTTGKKGVARRIDVLATAIKHKLTVKDLSELELCYSPPYGSSKDAINYTGMIALNHLRGLSRLIHWNKVLNGNYFLLDVRTENEFTKGSVPTSINIPLNELRRRLSELPKDRKIAVFCRTGLRSHIACRILIQKGFKAENISGGYLSYINYLASKPAS